MGDRVRSPGVDPDRDWITLAVVDAQTTGVIAQARLQATGALEAFAEGVTVRVGENTRTTRRTVECGRFGLEGSTPATTCRSFAGRSATS